ncbi:hypothetical protein KBI23_09520 [bacterium]|nr:hypothetical protein [bacterium]MBP9810413.1 hypothetical protein [bacterium]
MSNTQNTNAASGNAAKPTPPAKLKPGSWNFLPQQQPIDPDTSRRNIEARVLPTKVYDPKRKPGVKSLATGFGSNTVGGPASIVELTRALRDNVDLIYEWVHNNVETLTNYGIHKGGLGALTDGFGNSFDQADLMVKLLRQAGYTANYVSGELRMNAADAGAWLGTDPTNIFASGNFLGNSYTPVNTVWTGTEWVVDFSHCWVECTIGGTVYTFDPTIKSYSTVAGINLATAMGYNATTFMSDATSGATITSDYVENINRTNIRTNLDDLTMNLVDYIKTNAHGATLDEILGGRTINQYDAAVPLRQTAHPFLKSGTTPTVWTSVPNAYRATLHVIYDTIDETFYTDDLSNTRLTLFFNASHEAELRLDGTLIATSSAQTPGSWNSVFLEIVHPYAVTWADQSVWEQVWADKPHLICSSFGMTSRSSSQLHSRKMKANHANGGANDSDAVLGELMAALWGMWAASTSKTNDLVNRMTNCTSVVHHAAGLVGWYDTPFTNIGLVAQTTSALDNNYNQQQYNDTVLAMHGVAFEAQVFKQFGRIDGVSSTPIIDGAVAAGQKIYDGKTANWNSVVVPSVVNYTSGELADIESWWVNWGNRVALPEDGAQVVGSWNGFGYLVMPSFGTFGIIQGGLKGGGGACSLPIDDFVQGALYKEKGNITCGGGGTYDEYEPSQIIGQAGFGGGINVGGGSTGNGNGNENTSQEPIDLITGDYLLVQNDLKVGSQGFPYGLSFGRSYNSNSRYQDGPLGLGWTHNFQMTAQKGTDALMGMGDHSILGAAGSIVELFVSLDIQSDLAKPFDKYIVCAVGNQWYIDNLVDNTVTFTTGHQQLAYVKLPDGTFAPPRQSSGIVTDTGGGAYTLQTLQGDLSTYNTDGKIATWAAPYGVSHTFTYTSGKLTSVTNGLGRTLTLSYTGTRLTSVSDGNGRSVSYALDGSNNLVTVTDPLTNDWTFEYDVPGRMIKWFKPEFPTTAIATNTYNSLDQVTQQADANSNVWNYYFAGSRSEEENPNSKSSIQYYNRSGQSLKFIDQLGRICTKEYDGRSRIVAVVAPEGDRIETVFNAFDLATQVTNKAKPGAGLSDIVMSCTYDSVWKKVQTQTDPLGRVTSMSYDGTTGTLLTVTAPAIAGVGTPVMTMTYNARGQCLTVTDPSGMVVKNTYHATLETLTSTVVDFGVGLLNLSTNFGYDAVGNATTYQDPMGNTVTIAYDAIQRVTQLTAPSPFNYVTKFTYNKNGDRTKVERETGDAAAPWQTSTATYSAESLLLTAVDPLGRTTTAEYDNLKRLWKVTDAASRLVVKTYDDANRLSTVTDPTSTVCQTYTYTDDDKVASFEDARGNLTQYTFDGFNRPDKTIYMDGTFEQATTYDANSNPATILLRKDHPTAPIHRYKIDLTYDELNRVKTKVVTDDAATATTTNSYDIAGRLTNINLSGSVFGTGNYQKFFDTAGRFYKEDYPDAKAVTHVLDANGNITKTTYPDGSYFVDRVYDELNRLTDIKLNGSGTSAVQFQYDKLSRRTKLVYENGAETSYAFQYDNSLTDLVQAFVGSDVALSYGFDVVSQMSSQSASDPQFNWHPSVAGTSTYSAANSLDQYGTIGGVSQSYDASGCLTNDGSFTYIFNTENMLTQVKNAAGSSVISSYLYDPMQRQVQKLVGSVKTNFYYSGFQRLADYDGTADTLQNRYVYGTGLDEVLVQVASAGTKTYFHHNNQGSVIATTNSAGAVVDRYKYGPFGESAALTGTTHGYTGQRYDAETGLYYYKMRYYSPSVGRFLQPDPIGMAGGINLYAYVGNSPLVSADPLGLEADDWKRAGGGGVIGWPSKGGYDGVGMITEYAYGSLRQPEYSYNFDSSTRTTTTYWTKVTTIKGEKTWETTSEVMKSVESRKWDLASETFNPVDYGTWVWKFAYRNMSLLGISDITDPLWKPFTNAFMHQSAAALLTWLKMPQDTVLDLGRKLENVETIYGSGWLTDGVLDMVNNAKGVHFATMHPFASLEQLLGGLAEEILKDFGRFQIYR